MTHKAKAVPWIGHLREKAEDARCVPKIAGHSGRYKVKTWDYELRVSLRWR
jgi:hypothetical protein